MTKIVLEGAPGSGKTELAYDLQEALEDRGAGYYEVIDLCPENVSQAYNFGAGPLASHITDMAIAIDRLGQEYKAKTTRQQNDFIVCGSLATSAINTALTCATLGNDAAWEVGQAFAPLYPLLHRSSGISQTYLLPLGDDPDDYEIIIDDSLPSALEALGIDYNYLNPNAYREVWIDYIVGRALPTEKEVNDDEDPVEDSGEVAEVSLID